MIRYKLEELIKLKAEKEGRSISVSSVASEIGIQRSAMSKMVRDEGYSTTTRTLDALCKYFDCKIEDLIVYVPDNNQTD